MEHNGSTQTSQPQTTADHQPVPEPKRVGYGLPCARCKAYYAADLSTCPYCQCAERVAPTEQEIMRPSSALKEEIAGGTPLERLLGERIVARWLNLHHIDALYANRLSNISWAESEYFQRRQERANRQYLSAIRTLAQVRRLLVPAVQVNIGAQQLNVANASSGKQRSK